MTTSPSHTDALRELVPQVAERLTTQNLTLATTESCTGGGLSYWLTSIPGSSNWFERGFVTYSNAAKIDMLGVRNATLETNGAVSEETAREMAEGARRRSKANLSIAITGIAGPDGGSEDKPIGTVWIAVSGNDFATTSTKHVFTGDRQAIRLAAMVTALQTLLAKLG